MHFSIFSLLKWACAWLVLWGIRIVIIKMSMCRDSLIERRINVVHTSICTRSVHIYSISLLEIAVWFCWCYVFNSCPDFLTTGDSYNHHFNPFFQDWVIDNVIVPVASGYGLGSEYEYLKNSIKEYLTGLSFLHQIYTAESLWVN